jgi:hypothetical protein
MKNQIFSVKLLSIVLMVCLASPVVFARSTHQKKAVKEEAVSAEFRGVYKQGNGPLRPKTRVRMYRKDNNYYFSPLRSSRAPWVLHLKEIRGAMTSERGVWLYWFGEQNQTQKAFIKMTSQKKFAKEVNDAVNNFYLEQGKARFEAYKKKALKQAR